MLLRREGVLAHVLGIAVFLFFSSQGVSAEKRTLRVFTNNSGIMIPVFKEFEKAHRGVEVAYETRAKGNELRNIMRLELANKRYFDVAVLNLNMDMADLVHEFKGKGFLPFRPRNIAAHALNEPEHYWTVIFTRRYALAYNTNAIQGRAPTFKDLMDGKYEFMLDPQNYAWLEGLIQCLGQDAAKDFLRKLFAGKLLLRKGNSVIAMLVIAGEAPVGMTIDHIVETFRKRGAPIAWNPDADPVIANVSVAMLGQGQNRDIAKLFIEWLLSAEGQNIIEEQGVAGVRRTAQGPTCLVAPQAVSPEKWKAVYDEYRKILNIIP